jgi:hypothetical protein
MDSLETWMNEVKDRFLTEVIGFAPELRCAVETLLRRIGASNWTLEWGLPFWLGTKFGLAGDAISELMLCNAFGLGFVRIVDDLADGESPWSGTTEGKVDTARMGNSQGSENDNLSEDTGCWLPSRNDVVLLQAALHHLFIRQIHRTARRIRLNPSGQCGARESELHARFFLYAADRCIRRWLRATSERVRQPSTPFQLYTDSDFLLLAERGAPLEICCAASCSLAGRPRELRAVASVVDDLLVGCVLLDHVYDWALDLKAGRYNAFVAYCSDLPQCGPNRESNREAVLKEIYTGGLGRPYLARILQYLDRANDGAVTMRCDALVEFIRILREEICVYWNRLAGEVAKTTSIWN